MTSTGARCWNGQSQCGGVAVTGPAIITIASTRAGIPDAGTMNSRAVSPAEGQEHRGDGPDHDRCAACGAAGHDRLLSREQASGTSLVSTGQPSCGEGETGGLVGKQAMCPAAGLVARGRRYRSNP